MPRSEEIERIRTEEQEEWLRLLPQDRFAEMERDRALLPQFKRALDICFFNGFEPVRFVLSRRVSRRLGSPIKTIYGIPVSVDEDTDEGFGLVVRSP